MKVGIDLKDPSTYAGLIGLVGGASGVLTYLLPTTFSPLIAPISLVVTTLSGLAFTLTKDYASTPSKIDDAIHVIAGALSGKKEDELIQPENQVH